MSKSYKSWRNFLLFAAGTLVSNIGSGAQGIALPLYILDLTGSGTLMGTLTFLSFLPKILLSPIAGVFGDRINRKYLMVGLDYARGILILILGILVHFRLLTIPILFGFQIFLSTLDTFFGPATSAMIPDLIGKEELVRANSILGIVGGISQMIGPVIGGVIYGLGGIFLIFIINAISFLGSATFEIFIKYTSSAKKKLFSVKYLFSEIKEGITFVLKKRGLLILMGFSMFMNFVFDPFFRIVLPFIIRKIFKYPPSFVGFLEGALVGGVLVANILLSIFLSKEDTGKLIKGGTVLLETLFVLFLLSLSPLLGITSLIVIAVIGVGFSIPFINNPVMANIMKMAHGGIRSRVLSLLDMTSQMMIPFGALIFGFLLDKMPYYFLLIGIGVFTTILALLFIFWAPREVFYPE